MASSASSAVPMRARTKFATLGYVIQPTSSSCARSQVRSGPTRSTIACASSGRRSAQVATAAETVETLPGGRLRSSFSIVGRCAMA